MSKNSTNSLISLLVGLMLGGILGILFAPDKGNNTRDRLSFRLNKYKRKLENLILAGRFPAEIMPQFFKRSDVLLVTLKREEIFSYTVPSKIQAYLAAGRPIIAALDGEGARVIEDAGAGVTCAAEDVDGIVNCIERLYEMTDIQKQEMSERGRAYYEHNFEMESQAKNLIKILENRILNNEKR